MLKRSNIGKQTIENIWDFCQCLVLAFTCYFHKWNKINQLNVQHNIIKQLATERVMSRTKSDSLERHNKFSKNLPLVRMILESWRCHTKNFSEPWRHTTINVIMKILITWSNIRIELIESYRLLMLTRMVRFLSLSSSSSFLSVKLLWNRSSKISKEQKVLWTWNNFLITLLLKASKVNSGRSILRLRDMKKILRKPIKLWQKISSMERLQLLSMNTLKSEVRFSNNCGIMNFVNSTQIEKVKFLPTILVIACFATFHSTFSKSTLNI